MFPGFLCVLLALYLVGLATSISLMELFSGLLSLFTVGALLARKGYRWRPPPFWKEILFFCVVVSLGIFLNDSPEKWHDFGRLRFFLIYAGVFYYLTEFLKEPSRWIRILAAVTVIVGIYGALQHFMPLDLTRPEGKKVFLYAIQAEKIGPLTIGTFNHHLTFSNVFLFYAIIFTALGLFVRGRKWWLALSALLFIDCFWTQSRTLWAALPLVSLLLVLPFGWKKVTGVLAGLVVIFIVAYFSDAGFKQRLDRTLLPGEGEYSLSEREKLWQLSLFIFQKKPLLGAGWNNNERYCRRYEVERTGATSIPFCGHAHSLWLNVLAATGLLGIIAFLLLWVAVFRALIRSMRYYPRGTLEWAIAYGLIVAFIGFQIQGVTQWNFGDAEVLHNVIFFFAVTASLAVGVPRPEARRGTS